MARTQAHPKQPASASIASFETDFERLASIVDKLESGNIGLEEMLKLYEEAMSLSGVLRKTLDEAELRVEKLAGVHEEGMPAALTGDPASPLDDSDLLF